VNREKIEAAVRNYVKSYGMDNICRDDVIRYIEATGCSVSHVTADSITVAFPESGEVTLTGYVYSNQNVKDGSPVPVVFGLCGVIAGFTSILFAWLIKGSCIPVSKHDTALMVVQLATSFLDSVALVLLAVSLLIAGGKRVHERCFCAGRSLFKGKAGGSNAA
jgi:H+/Cl- antiporter ClcA